MAKTPSLQSLQKEILRLNARIDELILDPAFGLLTRPAVDNEYRKIQNRAHCLVYVDIDNLHLANKMYGHDKVNQKMKRACSFRRSDVLLGARWYSGDELIFILAGSATGFCLRLQDALKKEKLSATMAWIKSSGELHNDVGATKDRVEASKHADKRGLILRAGVKGK
jgi:GGDEF domain-containing protein